MGVHLAHGCVIRSFTRNAPIHVLLPSEHLLYTANCSFYLMACVSAEYILHTIFSQLSFLCKCLFNHVRYQYLLIVDPPEKLQQTCPTCPLLLPVDSLQAVNAARLTLASYKRQSMLGAGLGVKRITRAAAQVRLDI